MEFVDYGETIKLLREQGIREVKEGDELMGLELPDNGEVVHLLVLYKENAKAPDEGAQIVKVEQEDLPSAVEQIIHKLHLGQILLIPLAKWRKVFDAVAFSMVENEDWQAIDTAAAVALNTRDPLLCEPGDFHTLTALIKALLSDAESPEQGLLIAAPAAQFMVKLVPGGEVRISVGNPVLADEVVESLGV